MSNIVHRVVMKEFWSGWINRFEDNAGKYITPDEEVVVEEVSKVNLEGATTDVEKAERVWAHITHEIKWQLSEKWKTPKETLRDRIGDCEDMDFLMLSMLPNVGVNDAELVIGHLRKPSGGGGAHTWVELNGVVLDPTGTPEDVERISYDGVHRFEIKEVAKHGA